MVWFERQEQWQTKGGDAREPMDIDYGRIVHSASFRRLQGKTQVLNLGDSDFYRTRLTHSLEVAQIAGGITHQLRVDNADSPALPHLPDRTMIQAIGCTHDLGHPPFGHGGEVALNYCMRDDGGFEGNGQTLRILTKLEKFSNSHGSNLTRRVLLGSLKYPVAYSAARNPILTPRLRPGTTVLQVVDIAASKPPKCYLDTEADDVDWILQPLNDSDRAIFTSAEVVADKHRRPLHKSFDCTIMDVADDIAFGVHDLEDAIAMGLIKRTELERYVTRPAFSAYGRYLAETYKSDVGNDPYDYFMGMLFSDNRTRKHCINRLVSHFVTGCTIVEVEQLHEPLVRYRCELTAEPRVFLDALIQAVFQTVILSPSVQHLEFKGQEMVVAVFEVMNSDPKRFLPRDTLTVFNRSADPVRVICDHIAGMTDAFLLKTYDRLFSPRMGSVFDRL